MDYLVSKLPKTETTIFSVVAALTNEYQAVNLAQGFPDFGIDDYLIERITFYMKEGFNQYAPMPGVKILRERLAQKYLEEYQVPVNPETEVTITCGATEACFTVISSLVHAGDEVIVIEPAFDCYVPVIELCGGIPKYIKTSYPHFDIPWHEVEQAISSKTKLIIVNSPHNPTGKLFSEADVHALRSIVARHGIYVLSDEVYEHMVFDNQKHLTLAAYDDLKMKTFVVGSFGKTYHATGFRLGYCVAHASLTKEFRKIHQFNTFSAVTPVQYGIADMLLDKSRHQSLSTFFLSLIQDSRFEFVPTKGTYFQLLSYKNIDTRNEYDMAMHAIKEHGLSSIPVSSFYHDGESQHILRFCFAKKNETLEKAAEILCKI